MSTQAVNNEALEIFDLLPAASSAYSRLADAIQDICNDTLSRASCESDRQFIIEAAGKGLIPDVIARLKSIYVDLASEPAHSDAGANGGAAAVDMQNDGVAPNDRSTMPDFSSLLSDSQLSAPVRLALERLASGNDGFGSGLPTPLSSARQTHSHHHSGDAHGRSHTSQMHEQDGEPPEGAPESMMDVLNSDNPEAQMVASGGKQAVAPSLMYSQHTGLPGPSYSSSFRGVSVRGSKWNAQIQHEGKKVFLGTYETEIEAAKAYDSAARSFHGVRALTNFDEHGNVIVQHLVHRYGVRPEHNRKSDRSITKRRGSVGEEADRAVRLGGRRRKNSDIVSTAETLEQLSSTSLTPEGTVATGFPVSSVADSGALHSDGTGVSPPMSYHDPHSAERGMHYSMPQMGGDRFPAGVNTAVDSRANAAAVHDAWARQAEMTMRAHHPHMSMQMQQMQQAHGARQGRPGPPGGSGAPMTFTPAALMSALSSLLAPVAAASAMLNNPVPAGTPRESSKPASTRSYQGGQASSADLYQRGSSDVLSPAVSNKHADQLRYDGMEMLNLAVSKASAGMGSSRSSKDGDLSNSVPQNDFDSSAFGASGGYGNSNVMLSPKMVESMRGSRPRPTSEEASRSKRPRYADYYENEEQV